MDSFSLSSAISASPNFPAARAASSFSSSDAENPYVRRVDVASVPRARKRNESNPLHPTREIPRVTVENNARIDRHPRAR
jgi:hypothetical protein